MLAAEAVSPFLLTTRSIRIQKYSEKMEGFREAFIQSVKGFREACTTSSSRLGVPA